MPKEATIFSSVVAFALLNYGLVFSFLHYPRSLSGGLRSSLLIIIHLLLV
jgi:hypothetical protein